MSPQGHLLTSSSLDAKAITRHVTEDFTGGIAHPVNEVAGGEALYEKLLQPLHRAIPDLQRHPLIALASDYGSAHWEMGTGYIVGTLSQPLFGIPPIHRSVFLRYTEMLRLEGDRIAEWYLIPDLVDLMEQVGVSPLRPCLGTPGRILPPMNGGSIHPSGDGQATVELVMAMLANLGKYDGTRLDSMDLARFWTADFLWYGPAGIGTTRGIDGFRTHHQGPFLTAFPDRVVDRHAATVAAGNFAGTGGWPHMHATHSGPGWLGLPATGTRLELRVMDIWCREGDQLRENWVAIDIIHMLQQLGVDVFEQMQLQVRH